MNRAPVPLRTQNRLKTAPDKPALRVKFCVARLSALDILDCGLVAKLWEVYYGGRGGRGGLKSSTGAAAGTWQPPPHLFRCEHWKKWYGHLLVVAYGNLLCNTWAREICVFVFKWESAFRMTLWRHRARSFKRMARKFRSWFSLWICRRCQFN